MRKKTCQLQQKVSSLPVEREGGGGGVEKSCHKADVLARKALVIPGNK